MPHDTERTQAKRRLGALLEAWAQADCAGLEGALREDVVFASPFTEQLDAEGLTRGKHNLLQRLRLERDRFASVEIVDVVPGKGSLMVFLRAGKTQLTCLIEVDDEARFRRLIASLSEMPQV